MTMKTTNTFRPARIARPTPTTLVAHLERHVADLEAARNKASKCLRQAEEALRQARRVQAAQWKTEETR